MDYSNSCFGKLVSDKEASLKGLWDSLGRAWKRQGSREFYTQEVVLKLAKSSPSCIFIQLKEKLESRERFFRLIALVNTKTPIRRVIRMLKEDNLEVKDIISEGTPGLGLENSLIGRCLEDNKNEEAFNARMQASVEGHVEHGFKATNVSVHIPKENNSLLDMKSKVISEIMGDPIARNKYLVVFDNPISNLGLVGLELSKIETKRSPTRFVVDHDTMDKSRVSMAIPLRAKGESRGNSWLSLLICSPYHGFAPGISMRFYHWRRNLEATKETSSRIIGKDGAKIDNLALCFKRTLETLHDWERCKFGSFRLRIAKVKDAFKVVQMNLGCYSDEELKLRKELDTLLEQEEIYWKQRAEQRLSPPPRSLLARVIYHCMTLFGYLSFASLASLLFPDSARPAIYVLYITLSVGELLPLVCQRLGIRWFGRTHFSRERRYVPTFLISPWRLVAQRTLNQRQLLPI
ncbi:hypothetical protein ACH5RR_040251 [Cinchona calisaya]|uniref:Uncharacterized protein n=1 Tax=Cinchona calisaya TaxID=153742 RepID=A0ABD2XRN6_9GENT